MAPESAPIALADTPIYEGFCMAQAKERPKRSMNLLIPPSLHRQAKAIAALRGETISGLIRDLLDAEVERTLHERETHG